MTKILLNVSAALALAGQAVPALAGNPVCVYGNSRMTLGKLTVTLQSSRDWIALKAYPGTGACLDSYYLLRTGVPTNNWGSGVSLCNPGSQQAPPTINLNGGPGYPGSSTMFIGRLPMIAPGPSYDFKFVQESNRSFSSLCLAEVDANGVSGLWNGK